MSDLRQKPDDSRARGPRVAKTTTRSTTITTRAEFTAEELRKRLRLPSGTALTVVTASDGDSVVSLVASWTVTK